MIPLILTMGCIFLLCIASIFIAWAVTEMIDDGPDIKNIIIILVGIGISVFGFFSIIEAIDYYHEKESPKTEIITSVPAQIDTIITIRNSIPDTSYIYKFNSEE